jgi:hypothetical protein
LKEEAEISLKRSQANLISDLEKLYDQLLLQREEIQSINLEALLILKQVQSAPYDLNQLIQQILLKFNRVIFKLIDEKRIKRTQYPEILKKMEELEKESVELGYAELINEEFWLEIKAAINT